MHASAENFDDFCMQFFYTGLVAALATPWILVSFSQVWQSSQSASQSLSFPGHRWRSSCAKRTILPNALSCVAFPWHWCKPTWHAALRAEVASDLALT